MGLRITQQHLAVTKSARLYTIGDVSTAEEVWIVCHGYGQLAGKFIRSFESIITQQRAIVAPEALHRFYLDPPLAPAAERRVGATWMTREDRDADIRDNVAYLDAVAVHARGARPSRVRAFGFSQGCATIFRWAVLGATHVHELILWSGEVPPDLDLEQAKTRLANTRIAIVQGASDALMAASVRDRELLGAAGIRHEYHEHAGGHRLDSHLLGVLAARI